MSTETPTDEIYRFRRIGSLLDDFNELERQTIYFASPDELNDPMEGFRDMFWQGDYIVWRNLFNHYLLCLERICFLWLLSGEESSISKDQIPAFNSEEDFSTPQYKELFGVISHNFFANEDIREAVKSISQRTTPVRRDELLSYLRMIHLAALKAIFDVYKEKGLCSQEINMPQSLAHLIPLHVDATEKIVNEDKGLHMAEIFIEVSKRSFDQQTLISLYNHTVEVEKENRDFVLQLFPDAYLTQIEKLVFPDWYATSFTSSYENSSSWGHYAGNHEGACLIFEPNRNEAKPSISLKAKNGYGSDGYSYGFTKFTLYPIDYKKIDASIDFFQMLGRLSIKTLEDMWYMHDGKLSTCAKEIYKSEEQWRERYWERFYRDIMVKSEDWKHENEQRLILTGAFLDFSGIKDRTMQYEFKSLKGIIFGIKTSIEDKLKIMKIIDDKCAKEDRTDFKFYQAHYSPETGRITRSEMSLIQFTHGPDGEVEA